MYSRKLFGSYPRNHQYVTDFPKKILAYILTGLSTCIQIFT